jgi:sugar lactone lactonase YvrE
VLFIQARLSSSCSPRGSDRVPRNRSSNLILSFIAALPNLSPNARWAQNGVTVAGGHGKGYALNQFNTPAGLVVDEDQTIYVADNENHRIVEWKRDASQGRVVAGDNRTGHLSCPCDVFLDRKTDNLLICDRVKRSVMQWSRRNGNTQGETIRKNIYCRGLTMDEQRCLYVSDTGIEAVIRYREGETKGTVVAGSHGHGDHLNQLFFPTYLFVDREQSVYVSDSSNHRVMKWVKGATEGIVVAGAPGYGDDLTHLSGPSGLFVDALGTVYVADRGHGRVMCWPKGAKGGTVIVGGNGQGAEANQLLYPEGLSFDCHGHLYVVDSGNHRVQRFSIETS